MAAGIRGPLDFIGLSYGMVAVIPPPPPPPPPPFTGRKIYLTGQPDSTGGLGTATADRARFLTARDDTNV